MNDVVLWVTILGAGLGLIVNTVTILVIGMKGGHVFGRLQSSVDTLTIEITRLRDWKHELGNIDQRVLLIEAEQHELDSRLRGVEQLAHTLKADYDVRHEAT